MLAIAWTAIVLFLCNNVYGSEFFDKYCVYEKNLQTNCENFTLPNEKSDFIISNSEAIYIENANITAFNRNFINKIPNASSFLRFDFSTVNFTSEPVDTYHPLRTLSFYDTKVNGNRNTSILQSFEDLIEFELYVPSPKWMEYPSIDANFFKGNRKLEVLTLYFTTIDEDLNVDFLEDGSLYVLSNLKEVFYKNGRQTHISKDLFRNNKKLEELVMASNRIETLEKGALPSGLRSLDLSNNKIQNIQGIITDLINLYSLYLSDNKIEEINPGDFGKLEKLVALDISNNKIRNIHGIFTNLINLNHLSFSDNDIEEINPEDFKNLKKLERLDISNNKIKVLRLDHVKNIPNLRFLDARGNDGMEWEKDLETKVLAHRYSIFEV